MTVVRDPLAERRESAKRFWALGDYAAFAGVAMVPVAGELVRYAAVAPGERVLDVGTGSGVAAVTARARGARVVGLDLSPEMLEEARASGAVAGFRDVDWREGDVESLPFADGEFDVVLSQFAHMFAPRPDVATSEMLRVLRPGGRIAFATWPPGHFWARMSALNARYMPPPPDQASVTGWGDPSTVRERLGDAVADLRFRHGVLRLPALSAAHLDALLANNPNRVLARQVLPPDRLASYEMEMRELAAAYVEDNVCYWEYLLTRAVKR